MWNKMHVGEARKAIFEKKEEIKWGQERKKTNEGAPATTATPEG